MGVGHERLCVISRPNVYPRQRLSGSYIYFKSHTWTYSDMQSSSYLVKSQQASKLAVAGQNTQSCGFGGGFVKSSS